MAISPSPQVPDLGFRNRESGHSGITQHTPSSEHLPGCSGASRGGRISRREESPRSHQRFADAAHAGAHVGAGHAVKAITVAAGSSKTTHKAPEAVDACRYLAALLIGALRGVDKDTLLSPSYCPTEGPRERASLAKNIPRIADGSSKDRHPPDIKGTGYVVDAPAEATSACRSSPTSPPQPKDGGSWPPHC